MFPSEINEDGSLGNYQTRGIKMKTVILDIIIQTQTRTVCRFLIIKVYWSIAISLSGTIKGIETM